MERKLELKDIAGYLPHGLKIDLAQKSEYLGIKTVTGANVDKNTINKFRDGITVWCYGSGYNEKVFQFKPILRPLSDLSRTITYNGKEIVPIVELAKIVCLDIDEYKIEIYPQRLSTPNYLFGFNRNSFYILVRKTGNNIFYENQYQLFDYLHELKIDYRGLIDAGLAVDVNTLEVNPYK